MPLPEALKGDSWTKRTAIVALPLLIWCARNGKTVTYGQLDKEIVRRRLGHHVHAAQYGYPAGTIGDALIETEQAWGEPIPPLNALVVNAKNRLPGKGVNHYLQHYYEPDQDVNRMSLSARRAVVEEIHADIFAYPYWGDLLEEYGLQASDVPVATEDESTDQIERPGRGGWSSEGESKEHQVLKTYVAQHPEVVDLPKRNKKGREEYIFGSGDKADVVFTTRTGLLGVEVKSVRSNDADLNCGLFQAVKYQALLRAEQKAALSPPTARAVLVTERELPTSLQNLADILGIDVYDVRVND